ncbi:MAG: outer membrane protein transport protein [Myxococcales bacterium]|nr:outer membrane protein transport protein [Myxococcales bacterium]MCB9749333.1 outer membrane protein transport protein [Myxococcales bacterium]
MPTPSTWPTAPRTSTSRALTRGAFALSFALALAAGQRAEASGLATARFGGEHGHPTTDNPTATYYNPAGIGLSTGTHIFIDGTLALRWASYERPESAINNPGTGTPDEAIDANAGKATLFNVIGAPFVGVTSDFGTQGLVVGGASFSVPFGGQAVWNANEKYQGSDRYPGAVDGVQRWYTIDGALRSMYITGSLAFHLKKIGLAIGVSGSAIYSGVNTIRARNADGTDDLVLSQDFDNPANLKEGRSLIDVSGWQGGFGIGAVWHLRDKFWVGASYTSQPNVVGGMKLKGTLVNILASARQPDETEVEFTQTLPDIIRLGFRVRPLEKLELRLFGDFTRWSVMDKQCVLDSGVEDRNCEFPGADTALDNPSGFGSGQNANGDTVVKGVTQHLPRFWKNGGGVRFGASYFFTEKVEGYAGLGYDSTAVPVQTVDAALLDMHKMSVSVGGRFQIVRNFALALTLTDLIYFPLDTKGRNVLNQFQAPTRQADANGVYKSNIAVANLYLDVSF